MLMCYCASLCNSPAYAQKDIDLSVNATANLSSGKFAPYFISSLNHGKIFQKNTLIADISATKKIDYDNRFSWGYGAEIIGEYSNSNTYQRWNDQADIWESNPRRPSSIVLQQLYGEAKWRCLFMQIGLKEHDPAVLNPQLSSGDFVESGNARPMPEVRFGFHGYEDIPLTNGWLQIQCQLAFGMPTDYDFIKDRYNYYSYHITKGSLYNYKRVFFRTNPEKRLSVTFGMQAAAFFGGHFTGYYQGKESNSFDLTLDAQSFFNMIIPVLNSKEGFAEGSNLGSWDFYAQYRLDSSNKVCAYFQWPFEDGSGIARRNKMDGIWGLEYKGSKDAIVSGAVIEYVDFRDQSGPIHYAPGDLPNPTLTSEATGYDNYYNNAFYNAYAHYGMSIGTPFLPSPIYNLDGYPAFACNRANGIHVGINGCVMRGLCYRLLFGHQRGLGTYKIPYDDVRANTSFMVEAIYTLTDNIGLKGQLAIDRGSLRGNNTGGLLSVTYSL